MWPLIFTGIKDLITGWFNVKKSKNEAETERNRQIIQGELDWDVIAQENAKYSWKDEFITLIWYSPLVVAWFDPELAMKWVSFVKELPYFYQFGMFGIMAASFGLRWYFKSENFKIKKEP